MGLVVFPLLPSVGALMILTSTIKTTRQAGREMIQQRLNWGFAGLGVWMIIVSLFGIQPGDAILALGNIVPYFWIFAAHSTLIRSPEQLRQLAWIFMIPVLPITVLGLIQMLGIGASLMIPGTLITIWDVAPGGIPLGRMSSVFFHANVLAAYLQMVFIFALGLLADSYESCKQNQGRIWKSPAFIWLLVCLLPSLVCLILTSSRTAWSGVLLSSLIFTVYQGWYWILGIVSAIATIILSAAYAPLPLREPLRFIVPRYFWARITDEMYPNRPQAITRVAQWQFSGKMIQARPMTGWGLQSFSQLYQAETQFWLPYPHNLLLMLSFSLGIPATIALTGLVGWIITQSTLLFLNFPIQWRSERTIFFTYLVAFAGFMVSNIADVTALELRLNTLAWLLLSCICGLVMQSRSNK